MAVLEGAVLPQGSLILVTGANGYIGSHVVDQFLKHGYQVRGTVRDTKRGAWLTKYFEENYGAGKFQLVEVKDLTNIDSMKMALEGCAGFAAVASDVSFQPDPKAVIDAAVQIMKVGLEAAAETPSVKRVMLTSSSSAAPFGIVNKKYDLTPDSYNTAAVETAWSPEPHKPDYPVSVYSASKVVQEQEAWKFMEERKPGFVLNTVLPDFVNGKILSVKDQGYPSSLGILKLIWDGNMAQAAAMLPPQYEIDVEDTGRLHVAALLHPDAKGERIFGFAYPKNWKNTVSILRELYPQKSFPDAPEDEGEILANIVARPRAEDLLKWVKGSGWTSYKDSIKAVCDTLI